MSEENNSQNAGLIHVVVGVLLPALILHKLSAPLGALAALGLALSFPILLFWFEFYRNKKVSPVVVLGFINTLVTGGLAVLGFGGLWFSIKEAFFPFIIGAFILLSTKGTHPFIKTLFLNPQVMHVDKIYENLKRKNTESEFEKQLILSTRLLSLSFFFSALLNFLISLKIFVPIDPLLDPGARSVMLNEQIAKMTTTAMVVLTLPSMLFLVFIIWNLLKGIQRYTDLTNEQIMK